MCKINDNSNNNTNKIRVHMCIGINLLFNTVLYKLQYF